MQSYFFVHRSRLQKIVDIQKLNISEIVIDLEDAVKFSERKLIIERLIATNEYQKSYIRIPLYNETGKIDTIFYRTRMIFNHFQKYLV